MAYDRLPTVRVADPDKPGDYLIINQADYKANRPQEEYELGIAYNPVDYPLFDRPVRHAAPDLDEQAKAAMARADAELKAATAKAAAKK